MKLKKWSEPVGINEVTSEEYDLFYQPLVNQPGEVWEYGVGLGMPWIHLIRFSIDPLTNKTSFRLGRKID